MVASTFRGSHSDLGYGANHRHHICCFGLAICRPSVHELAPLLEQVATPVSGFGLVADGMRQGLLADLVRERSGFACPIPEGAAEAVNRDVISLHAPQLHGHCHCRQRLASGGAREAEVAGARLLQCRRMATARADSGTRCSLPAFMRLSGIIHTALSRSISSQRAPEYLAERQARQNGKLKRLGSDRLPATELGEEIWCFRRVAPHDGRA